MLKRMQIANLAVIDHLELNFASGMTVLTGETGAGKSILIDALGLILGNRADTSVVRTGCERTEIVAIFSIPPGSPAARLLQAQSITMQDDELMIRRVVNRDSGSRAYINTTAVPVQLLRELGEHLIDIHGQQANQALFKAENLLMLLDRYSHHADQLAEVQDCYHAWQQINRELQGLASDAGKFNAQVSLLEYQLKELENLDLEENEVEQLENDHKRLTHIEQLLHSTQTALTDLDEGEHSISNRLGGIMRDLNALASHDARLGSISGLLELAQIQIAEACTEMEHYLSTLEQNPEQLHKLEQRLDLLHDVARKHHIHPDQLLPHFQSLNKKWHELLDNKHRIMALEQQQAKTLQRYKTCAETLHQLREQQARKMSVAISRQLQRLGMPDSQFTVKVNKLSDLKPHRHGISQVNFYFSANPGQAPQPMRKVASGGELSRISLAIQINARQDRVTAGMVFDEVDAGIGGGTAEIVGQLLHRLAGDNQVLCVTHLPQVASQADNHLLVSKQNEAGHTHTAVTVLSRADRVEEIARMLGGVKISEQTRHHAMEMLGIGRGS